MLDLHWEYWNAKLHTEDVASNNFNKKCVQKTSSKRD